MAKFESQRTRMVRIIDPPPETPDPPDPPEPRSPFVSDYHPHSGCTFLWFSIGLSVAAFSIIIWFI